jgi:hypothetical protein
LFHAVNHNSRKQHFKHELFRIQEEGKRAGFESSINTIKPTSQAVDRSFDNTNPELDSNPHTHDHWRFQHQQQQQKRRRSESGNRAKTGSRSEEEDLFRSRRACPDQIELYAKYSALIHHFHHVQLRYASFSFLHAHVLHIDALPSFSFIS